jgi:hypothetical protein
MLGRFILLPLMTWPVLACSCGSYEPLKACQLYQSTPVIFRGRVIDHNDDTVGMIRGGVLYRFQIVEAFKGVSRGDRWVFIDPASGTSCQTQFSAGHDYLIYVGGTQPAVAAMTVFTRSQTKSFPVAWKGLEQASVYGVGVCSPTRAIDDKDDDLAYLRSASAIGIEAPGWIEGRAVQNFSWPWRFIDFLGAPNATLTATSRAGALITVPIKSDGTFRIDSVPPGAYAITANSPILGDASTQSAAEVPSGGCSVANVSFKTLSTISGKVVDAQGKPAPDIRLELGELQGGGKVRDIPQTWANTDNQGIFKISNVPVGRIVLAANLNGAPTSQMPFDPLYVPGTQRLDSARVFSVQPGSDETGVQLRLPQPLPFGSLYVDVLWPDGTPAIDGARAFADIGRARADFEHCPKASNRVTLRLAVHRQYEVRVDWLDAKPGNFRLVDGGEPQKVDFMKDGQTVQLRLKAQKP